MSYMFHICSIIEGSAHQLMEVITMAPIKVTQATMELRFQSAPDCFIHQVHELTKKMASQVVMGIMGYHGI